MKNFYVYTHSTVGGQIFYVGKGQGKRHLDIKNRNKHWYKLVKKHKGYVINVVKNGLTCEESLQLEIELIAQLKKKFKLCNITSGGQGTSGRIISKETRQKMSRSSKGNTRCLGRVLSEETKRKIGDAHRGRKRKPFTLETRLKMSRNVSGKNNPMYQREVSAETRKKLSIAGTGRKHTKAARLKMSISIRAAYLNKRKYENNNG